MAKQAVSYIDPCNVSEGFSLPEGPYKVVGGKVMYWNYNKEVEEDDPNLSTFIRLDFQATDKKGKVLKGAETKEQYMSVGKAIYVQPSKDGLKFKKGPQAEKDTLGGRTNWGFFFTQFKACGDPAKLGDSVGIDKFFGLTGVLTPVALPKRDNVEGFSEDEEAKKKREKYGEKTLPVFTSIIAYPDGSAGGGDDDEEDVDETEEDETPAPPKSKKTAKPAAGKKPAKVEEEDDDAEEEGEDEKDEEGEDEESEEAEEEGGESDAQETSDVEVKAFLKGKKAKVKVLEVRMHVFKAKAIRADEDLQAKVLKLWKDPDNYTAAAKAAGFKVVGDEFVPIVKK